MNKKAVLLLSGGLDSILAAKLMLEQGIELEAIHFAFVFSPEAKESSHNSLNKTAKDLGIRLTVKNITKEFLEVVKNPKHGYGSGVNPCIDCKVFMFKKAKEFMEKVGASFIVTGEVLGERPMSQRRDTIMLIEKEAGLKKMVLRPLSAKLFEPTIAEEMDIVDRERLMAISGRSRKPQFELAKNLGIKEYPNPAGGCLLTDPAFSKRTEDLLKYNIFDLDNVVLLKVGRHFRISENCKLVVGRNEKENEKIFSISKDGDLLVDAKDLAGPLGLLRGEATAEDLNMALRIVARYVDKINDKNIPMEYWNMGSETKSFIEIEPLDEKGLERIRI